jgi:hypothetical protein
MFTITIVNREKVKIEVEFTKSDLKWLETTVLFQLRSILDDPPPSSSFRPVECWTQEERAQGVPAT